MNTADNDSISGAALAFSEDALSPEHFNSQQRVIIIGAGCFGLSTAYHLLTRGYMDIIVLDRSTVLPAPDASSNDINRIVRSSYNDKFYAQLAHEAIHAWKDKNIWGDTYHEYVWSLLPHVRSAIVAIHSSVPRVVGLTLLSPIFLHARSGVLVLDYKPEVHGVEGGGYERDNAVPVTGSPSYADESYLNDLELGCSLMPLPDPSSIRSVFPSAVPVGSFEEADSPSLRRMGYLNRDGGWADAGQGVRILLSKVKSLGAKIHPGRSVCSIQQEAGRVTGVSCTDGTLYEADLVVIATGSWSPSTFTDLGLQNTCLATGHCVAMIQLTELEAEQYKDCPVVLDFTSGFYVFPPTAKNVLKLALHGPGVTHTTINSNISTPRTILSDPDDGLAIPKEALQELRKYLCEIYPDLARKPFSATRLCWYNDTADGDWVISRYSGIHNLIFAIAGIGHAYKFLPVIGRLVADLIEDNLEPILVKKFSVNRVCGRVDGSRSGVSTELDLSQLCSPEDLDALNYD